MDSTKNNDKQTGIILALCAISAIIVCNTSFYGLYQNLINSPILIKIGDYELGKPIILWINEGLMAIFFLFVTLEIKREMISGSLNTHAKRALPFWGALGGMIVPAFIYLYLTNHDPSLFDGWAIPTATDIVFALSLLSLIVDNCPKSIRAFLLALAVFDDIGAIIIIALYYTNHISILSFVMMVLCCFGLYMFNKKKITKLAAYVLVGSVLWLCVLKSGVHATLAGIVVALALPTTSNNGNRSLAEDVEHNLEPWINYFVLPVFAFANSGVSFAGTTISHLLHIMPIAIICGLVIGKQIGITLFSYLAIKLKLAELPENISMLHIYGVSILCGVGFTMSLFIGTLAFEDAVGHFSLWVRVGVIGGSVLSALLAVFYFKMLKLVDIKS